MCFCWREEILIKKISSHFGTRYIGPSCFIFISSSRGWLHGQVLPCGGVQSEFVSGLSELQMLWRNSKQWNGRDWKSISGSVADFLCCSVGNLLGPGFQKSLSRYLANWFWKSVGLYDIQLLKLHILSSWLSQNSVACPLNTHFECQINIFLILF